MRITAPICTILFAAWAAAAPLAARVEKDFSVDGSLQTAPQVTPDESSDMLPDEAANVSANEAAYISADEAAQISANEAANISGEDDANPDDEALDQGLGPAVALNMENIDFRPVSNHNPFEPFHQEEKVDKNDKKNPNWVRLEDFDIDDVPSRRYVRWWKAGEKKNWQVNQAMRAGCAITFWLLCL